MATLMSTLPGAPNRIEPGVAYRIRHRLFGRFLARVLWVRPGCVDVELLALNLTLERAGFGRGESLQLSAALCEFQEVK